MNAANLISLERREQLKKHGITVEQDLNFNKEGQLAEAARKLSVEKLDVSDYFAPKGWDEAIWEKMINKPYPRRLLIAGALIAAEYDRLAKEEGLSPIEELLASLNVPAKERPELENIMLLSDRTVVLPDPVTEVTKGGIIIPDAAGEKPKMGTVLSIGVGLRDLPMVVEVGDRVLFGQFSGTEVVLDGDTYLLMRESDIFAIL